MKNLLIGTLLLTSASMALAESPRYSYAHTGYSTGQWDCCEGDYTAWDVGATMEVKEHVFISGSVAQGSQDEIGRDIDSYAVGVGYFSQMGADSTWHSSLGYKLRNIHNEHYDGAKLNSVVWEAGARHNISQTIEIHAGLLADFDNDFGTSMTYTVGTVFYAAPGLGIELGLMFNPDSSSSIRTGVRYNF